MHRHRLPATISRASSRVGDGFSRRPAVIVVRNPGVQKPHCRPWQSLNACCTGLRDNPDPSEEEAREMIAGNLCRCTGYQNIVKSVLRAAEIEHERSQA